MYWNNLVLIDRSYAQIGAISLCNFQQVLQHRETHSAARRLLMPRQDAKVLLAIQMTRPFVLDLANCGARPHSSIRPN